MKICFTGDLFLGGDLLNKDCDSVIKSTAINNADQVVVNLEQPISNSNYVEDKCTLYTGDYALKQLQQLNIVAVNLAHNHIQDKGLEGIHETVNHLDSVGIGHFGAGSDIKEASKPYWLNDETAIFGYCEFDKPYLNQITIADNNLPGVNPLRLKKIQSDLNSLPKGTRAVLYFHWGMEHVWLPPYEDIELAKKLLEDPRVLTIIGMHPHRVQGVVEHNNKKAYMCLGNFLFPNFYIAPPTQIAYPSQKESSNIKYQTRQYHRVSQLTYKKWRWVNRLSMVIHYDTKKNDFKYSLVMQDDDKPIITDLKGLKKQAYKIFITLLSKIYTLPAPVYKLIWKLHSFQVKKVWRIQIRFFQIRQQGLIFLLKKVLKHARR